jgi:CheY-like chemotaxis protein
VLIEDPDGAVRSSAARFLQREGFDVAVCAGPEAMEGSSCPEVSDGACPLVEDADLVYTSLRWSRPDGREVLRAHRRCYPETPVVVEICQPQAAQVGELLDGCHVVHVPCGNAKMLGAIQETLAATSGRH